MKKYQRGYIDFKGIGTFLIMLGVCGGVVLGGLIFKGIPWLWEISKPWLHQITG
jgi:hypothetical protein